jgi:hypothetical protein
VFFAIAIFSIFISLTSSVTEVKSVDHELRLHCLQSEVDAMFLNETFPCTKDDASKINRYFFRN